MTISRIGKCRSCKQTSRRDYTDIETYQERIGYVPGANLRPEYQQRQRFGRIIMSRFVRASLDAECPRCGEYAWNAKRIEGFKTEEKCGGMCRNAKGHSCDCSCGGENHGKGYMVCEAVAA